jgi:N-formylglutamate amidohydrolase
MASPDDSAGSETPALAASGSASHSVAHPVVHAIPLVFASPHSGQEYPPEFIAASRLDPILLRRSEDAFIDRIFGAAPQFGAPLLRAHFPRVYVDPNREPFELDPAMFDATLPDYVNATSPRVAAGLGTIARVVANGEEVYRGKLSFAEARTRIETHYFPYHSTLQGLLNATSQKFGCYLLIDCHSMPSIGGPMDADPGLRRLDVVLGDCHGTTCAPEIVETAEQVLRDLGLTVRRNVPYAGGFTTRHYAQPRNGRHALQIEVNRCLYMDEHRIRPSSGLERIREAITSLIRTLAGTELRVLRAG